jgi:multidrug efflux pump subunit AcrA (membrane-fusion protein)
MFSKNLFQPPALTRFDVSTLCDRGVIRLIFAVNRDRDRQKKQRWREFIGAVNLHNGIHSLIAEDKRRRSLMISRKTMIGAAVAAAILVGLWLVPVDDRSTGLFSLEPATRAALRAPEAGFITEILVKTGERVEAGSVAARMEIPEMAGRLRQKRAEAHSLEVLLHDLKRRGRPTQPSEWARLAAVKEEIQYLEEVREKMALRSPIAGVVATPHLDRKLGGYVLAGETVCEIHETSILEAEIALPEKQVERVSRGQPIELKALALPFDTFRATVERVAPKTVTDQQGRWQTCLMVYCTPSSRKEALRPGMTGYARILTGSRSLGGLLVDRVMRFIRTEFWW